MTGPDVTLVLVLACGVSGTALDVGEARQCVSEQVDPAADQTPAQSVPPDPGASESKPKEIFYSVTLGAGFNENYPNGEFFRFSAWKPGRQGITLDVGEQHAGGDSSIGIGATYWRNLTPKASFSVNAGGGTAPWAPQAWVGGSISGPILDIAVTAGANYRDWRDGNYATEMGVGLQKWFPHWIVGGGATYSQGQPASFTGWRGNVGLTYYVWRRTYVGVSVDFGKVRQREWQYDTRSRGINVGFSQWFGGSSGISVSAGRSLDDEIYGVSVAWFKEW